VPCSGWPGAGNGKRTEVQQRDTRKGGRMKNYTFRIVPRYGDEFNDIVQAISLDLAWKALVRYHTMSSIIEVRFLKEEEDE